MDSRPLSLIVDTDVGFDDFLAIAYLLSCPNVTIEAFTVVDGISDVDEGAAGLLLLQEKANISPRIPVYKGRRQPLVGSNAFPAEWRHQATQVIQGLNWGTPAGKPQPVDAVDYLSGRLSVTPANVLAIGPLSNFGAALQKTPALGVDGMVVMGGAVGPIGAQVGNIPPGLLAEGNIFVDPTAAQMTFGQFQPQIVPLNATSQVIIDRQFVNSFHAGTVLGGIVKQILGIIATNFINPGDPPYNAWDPLAALSFVVPSVLTNLVRIGVGVQPGTGVTMTSDSAPTVTVALGANAETFIGRYQEVFLGVTGAAG